MSVEAGPEGEAVVRETFLDRFDLSWALTVVGLSLGYLLFMWGLVTIPASAGGKIVSTVALTLGAFYTIAHMTAAPGHDGKPSGKKN